MNWLIVGVLLSGGATSMLAADPFAGTWKQNKQMGGGALYVPSETVVVKKIEFIDANTAKITDSESIGEETFHLDGGSVRITKGRNAGEEDSLKRLDPKV